MRTTGELPLQKLLASPALALAVVATALGILAGGLIAFIEYSRPATYLSTSVLLIDQPQAIAASPNDGEIAKLSRLRYKYAGIVTTETFSQPVAKLTGLPVGFVRASLTTSVDPPSLLLTVGGVCHSKTDARVVADAAAHELVSYVATEQNDANIPSNEAVSFSIVSPATAPARIAPDHKRAALVGVFVFVVITVAGLLGAEFLRRYRRT